MAKNIKILKRLKKAKKTDEGDRSKPKPSDNSTVRVNSLQSQAPKPRISVICKLSSRMNNKFEFKLLNNERNNIFDTSRSKNYV